jgi:hypothetical protein
MKKTLIILLMIFSLCNILAQSPSYVNYINSFKEDTSSKILFFKKIVDRKNRMTKEEALDFVYNGDTSRLYCYQASFNMETEKVEGSSRDLYLPDKCLKINMPEYTLIGYSSYKCKNPNQPLKFFLNLIIVNKKYQLTDSLIVLESTDFDSDISGLLNPKTEKLFLVGYLKNRPERQAIIYKINSSNLKFEIIKELNEVSDYPDDLMKTLEILGWKELFMN